MTSINDITGDKLKSKPATDLYYEGYDRIFGTKQKEVVKVEEDEIEHIIKEK